MEAYRKKRNFVKTAEPLGHAVDATTGNRFVIQKHAARRLHYDLRLELDGVLKSWAIARGPSLLPDQKRLAVHVEDHPLEYGDFEGTIPKGEYGGGTVIVWDRGEWQPVGDPHRGYAKGHLDFELKGEKLRGRWHLVRMNGRPREKRENWLLIKADDAAARSKSAADILVERPESVKTGRMIEDVSGEAPGWSSKTGKIEPTQTVPFSAIVAKLKGIRKGRMPDFVEPCLAALATDPPAGDRWIHEVKFDGYRLQAHLSRGQVTFLTRGALDWTAKLGKKVASSFRALPVEQALIDGELVVEDEAGASHFPSLQTDLSEGRTDRFIFYAFDLLHLDGYDLRAVHLIERKNILRQFLGDGRGSLRFSAHFEQDGDVVLQHACRLSLEGIVSKLRASTYREGRNKSWTKSKCTASQELIVCGFVPSTTSHKAIGSLVLGYYDKGNLIPVGRVGTGYTATVAQDLYRRLEDMRIPSSPFARSLDAEAARHVRYVNPELVVEIALRGWTADGNLRHASFRGVREDKPAREVVRETLKMMPLPRPKSTVKLSHPDRLYWPDAGVTKEGLADYYADVWQRMSPFIVNRPLALVRCPDGVAEQCFFQKHVWKGLSHLVRRAHDPEDRSGEPLIVVDDLDGLIELVQAGALEIHPWGSTTAALEQPDMIVMDLDPAENVPWDAVVSAAEEVRDRFSAVGLTSFVKTSGGKGLHVACALKPRARWGEVKAFTKRVAEAMASDSPGRFVAKVTKARRKGKIFVDYLRNGRGATAIAPYSTRARPGAAVSMPLAWEELSGGAGPSYFTVNNALIRLSHLASDPWSDFWLPARPLPTLLGQRGRSDRAALRHQVRKQRPSNP
nr:DNA ligase D [Microvirga terricola]